MNKHLSPANIFALIITIILILAIVFSLSVPFWGIQKSDTTTPALHDELSLKDIYIPEEMDQENIGLFLLDSKKNQYRTDSETLGCDYDPSKPLIIYFHGWGDGALMRYPSRYINQGYNVASFLWGEMSTDDPFAGQSKLWGTNNKRLFFWERSDGTYEFNDVPSHSVAEIFIAFYNDFLKQYGFSGSNIHFVGHSLGAQLILAITNYMTNGIENGTFNKEYLPDKVSLLDPYLIDFDDSTKVNWLDNVNLKNGGSTKMAYYTVKTLREYGVPVSCVRTSLVKISGDVNNTGYYQKFLQYVTIVDPSSDWIMEEGITLANIMDISDKHNYAISWFSAMVKYKELALDYSYEGEYGVSPFLADAYMYSRAGVIYDMPVNTTESDMSDDYQYSNISDIIGDTYYQNVTNPQISGFAFLDKNNNGINDDRIANRIANVNVKLYKKDGTLIGETTTAKSGYYEFKLSTDTVGNEYYIAISKDGYKIGNTIDETQKEANLMNYNTIASDGKSETVKIDNNGSLRILNIGLTK